MKKRQSTVEPVIGTLVNFLGMKRVNTKGLEQANKCLTMAGTAYNLKKLLKSAPKPRITTMVQSLKVDQMVPQRAYKSLLTAERVLCKEIVLGLQLSVQDLN